MCIIYFVISSEITLIFIFVWTSGCKFIDTLNLPKVFISLIGWITDEFIIINSSVIQPIKEIKTLGKFKVSINLHPEVQTNININVISEEITK